ncbi:MAG: flippase [Thermoplasmatota archaeon]
MLLASSSALGFMGLFAAQTLIGRQLGPAAYGVFAVALVLVQLAATVGSLGLATGAARLVASSVARKRTAEAGKQAATALTIGLLGGFLLGALLYSLRRPLAERFDMPGLDGLLSVMAFAVPFLTLLQVGVGVGLGHRLLLVRAIGQDLGHNGAFLLGVALAVLWRWGIDAFAGAYVAATIGAALGVVVWLFVSSQRRAGSLPQLSTPRAAVVRESLAFSLPLLVSASLIFFMSWTDILALGVLADDASVGRYEAGQRVAKLLSFPASMLILTAMPWLTRLLALASFESTVEVYRRMANLLAWFSVPGCIAIFFHGPAAVQLLFGAEFNGAGPAVQVLSLGFLAANLFGPTGSTLAAAGLSRFQMLASLVGLCLNVVLNLLFIPVWGLVGAAVATAVSIAAINAIRFARLRRLLPLRLGHPAFLVAGLPVVALAWVVVEWFNPQGILGLVGAGVGEYGLYMILVWKRFNQERFLLKQPPGGAASSAQ